MWCVMMHGRVVTLRLSFCLLRFYSAIVFLLFAQLFHCKRICVDRLCEFGKNCLFFSVSRRVWVCNGCSFYNNQLLVFH